MQTRKYNLSPNEYKGSFANYGLLTYNEAGNPNHYPCTWQNVKHIF